MSSGGIPRFAKKLENKESSDNGKPGHSVVREGTPVPLIDKNNSEFDEFEDFDMVFPSYEEANETDTFMNFDNSDLDEDECTPNTSSVKVCCTKNKKNKKNTVDENNNIALLNDSFFTERYKSTKGPEHKYIRYRPFPEEASTRAGKRGESQASTIRTKSCMGKDDFRYRNYCSKSNSGAFKK